jgi:hypothetical protein
MTDNKPGADGSSDDSLSDLFDPYGDAEWGKLTTEAALSISKDGNPLHAWNLVLRSVANAEMRTRRTLIYGDEKLSTKAIEAAAAKATPHLLPQWVWDYLRIVAWRLLEMGKGRDWRQRPEFPADPNAPGAFEPHREYDDSVDFAPKSAAELVSASLSLTKRGWSAFDAWERKQHAEGLVSQVNARIEYDGISKAAAISAVMSEYGYMDARSFRRLLKQGEPASHVAPGGAKRRVQVQP